MMVLVLSGTAIACGNAAPTGGPVLATVSLSPELQDYAKRYVDKSAVRDAGRWLLLR
jgi:hypothetical protein